MYDANGQTAPLMTDKELKQFSEFIYSELGIKITQTKKTMLQARLQPSAHPEHEVVRAVS